MMLVAARFRFLAFLISLVLAVVGAGPARGDIIALYPFAEANPGRTGPGYEATKVDPHATAIDVSLPDSLPPSGEDYIENPPTGPLYDTTVLRIECGPHSNNPIEAVANGRYFEFTVTANTGFALNLDSLTFEAARGGAATPRGWALLSFDTSGIASFVDSQDVPTVRNALTPFTVDLSDPSYQNLSTVTFRVYTYTPGGGRSVEYRNVTLNGTVR